MYRVGRLYQGTCVPLSIEPPEDNHSDRGNHWTDNIRNDKDQIELS